MINLKDPKDQLPSIFAIAGIGLLIASIVGLFMLPGDNFQQISSKKTTDLISLDKSIAQTKDNLALAQEVNLAYLRTEKSADITPISLAKLSKLVADSNLGLVSFRPQKGIEGNALLQLQYNLAVEGPYTNVSGLLERIEKSDAKLAVNSVQYASSEGQSDKVTASIGLVAFREIEKKAGTTPATKPVNNPVPTGGTVKGG